MANYFRPHTKQRARIAHVCIACLHPIPVGETYTAQSGFYDGRAFRNKYHPECMTELFAQMREFCTDEFMPGELEPPARLAAALSQGGKP